MLTDEQIRALLAAAMGYDNRRPGELNVAAWREASTRGNWTFDAALDALHEHCTHNPGFIQPGHITQRLRAERRQPADYTGYGLAEAERRAELEAVQPAVRQLVAGMATEMAWPPRTIDPERAIPCPYEHCHAAAGKPCVRRARRDETRPISGYHRSRTEAARADT